MVGLRDLNGLFQPYSVIQVGNGGFAPGKNYVIQRSVLAVGWCNSELLLI